MSDLVIRDVGETLIELLRTGLGPAPAGIGLIANANEIALVSPVNAGGQSIRLTLFLYSVTPAPELRNDPPVHEASGRRRRAPLPLDLYYLMTPTAREDDQAPATPTERSLDSHRLLGAAMRVFYDNGILSGGLLRGHLAPSTELRLSLQPITVEDLTRVWSVFPDSEYRPSVSYLVTPARIDSRVLDGRQRVVSRRTDIDRMVPHPAGYVAP